jgi:hypothetical protein
VNDARAQRPTPGPTATMFSRARQALSDAQAAGDVALAARILMQCAARLAAYDQAWSEVRPALGIKHQQRKRAA